MDEESMRDFLSNDDNIVNVIKNQPQTYNTILSKYRNNGTFCQILRRRTARLIKEQRIWKIRIPGTRWGVVLFCIPNHDYRILSTFGHLDVNVYYMYEFEETKTEIILKEFYKLNKNKWCEWEKKNKQLIIPKYKLRYGCFKLW